MMKWYPSMETCSHLLLLLAWLMSVLASKHTASGINIQCVGKEREALLHFKQGIQPDSLGFLTAWVGQECCNWHGVRCSDRSGHVISLNLSGAGLYGEIRPHLGNLSSLTSLDLSNNDGLFVTSSKWLSRLTMLRDIDLSSDPFYLDTDWMQVVTNLPSLRSLTMDVCSLSTSIPSSLVYPNSSTTLRVLSLRENGLNDSSILDWVSNLTRIGTSLEYLDLSYNGIPGPILGTFENYMHSLLHLDLSGNELQGPIPSALGNMHSLSFLDLSGNELQGPIPSALGNMHSLSFLHLSLNKLRGPIPTTLGNMHLLSYLDLSHNALEGAVPGSIFELKLLGHLSLYDNNLRGIQLSNSSGNLCSLQTLDLRNNKIVHDLSSIIQTSAGCANNSLVSLDLSNNSIWGSIPRTIGAFSSLADLQLYGNKLDGTISPSLGRLSRLESLDLSSNSLRGTLLNHHLSNLSRLTTVDLSNNPELVINISADWVPPFQLVSISVRSCKSPYFPKWLLTQTHLSTIDISNAGIFDTIPTSFWNLLDSGFMYLNLSNNKIHGVLPDLPPTIGLSAGIDLSSNWIEGAIPSFLINSTALFLNDNRFSGSIASLCPKFVSELSVLDLSNNFLWGELPDCWQGFPSLRLLHLDSNNFTGKLPPTMSALSELGYLSMRNNSFNGELQIPTQNWTSLDVLDLAYNSFSGHIPAGIGSSLHGIKILNLANNKIFGKLPLSLCQLSELHVLDLSYNQIWGTIPECICHLQGMTISAHDQDEFFTTFLSFTRHIVPDVIMWKREEQKFVHLGILKYIDISNNQLQGQIPKGISSLNGLASLDLARNNLTGSIPPMIGELRYLEFLDLSRNHLYGQIPSSLANLNFLGTLDLSYNNLSGVIPTSTQLQGFDPVSYMGNPGLCGPPLRDCSGDPAPNMPKGEKFPQEENDGRDMFPGLYVSVVLGFIVGFWGVCGTLVIKRSWRHTYFRFVEKMYDRFYGTVVVTLPRVWRRP